MYLSLSPNIAWWGAAPVASRLSNETRESMEVIMPRWKFVSRNPDVPNPCCPCGREYRRAIQLMQNPTSGGDRFWPGIPDTCRSKAFVITSTAGLAHAEGDAALSTMRVTVIDEESMTARSAGYPQATYVVAPHTTIAAPSDHADTPCE